MGKHFFKDVYNHLANWMNNVAEQDEMHRKNKKTVPQKQKSEQEPHCAFRVHTSVYSFLELREVYVWSMKYILTPNTDHLITDSLVRLLNDQRVFQSVFSARASWKSMLLLVLL